MNIKHNFLNIQNRIENACTRSGRNSSDVKIVVVTKTVQVPEVCDVIKAGATIIGENRVDRKSVV